MPTPSATRPFSFYKSVLLLLIVALLIGCSPPPTAEEPVRAVKLLTAGVDVLQAHVEYAGEVRARVESRLGFRVPGKIIQRQAQLGEHVRAGQVLAQLDPQDYQLAANAAHAQLLAATTQRDLAAADYKRYASLRDQNFISGAELERRDTALKAAQAALDQAHAQRSAQTNQATYTRLVSDVAGVVTAVEAEPGQVVGAGTTVVRVAQDGVRDVVFFVPEDKVAQMQLGQDAAVRGWAGGAGWAGRVREVSASADAATRTYQIKVAIDGPDAPALGSTVYVAPRVFNHAGAPAMKLPTTALRQDGQATAVWVYDPKTSTVKSQVVQIATADGNEAVVAGLVPGTQVVATGVHVLSPGQKVVVYQPKMAIAPVTAAQSAINSIAIPVAPISSSEAAARAVSVTR